MMKSRLMPALYTMGLILISGALLAQSSTNHKLNLSTGKDIYLNACVGCHGPDGKGAPDTTVGFTKPDTFPDFADCAGTTAELDADWKATIHDGGKARGFSRIMPAFGEALTANQIDMVVGYLRGLCTEKKWPRGELNFPRAQFTEKAFPENETIITSQTNVKGNPGVGGEAVYERRIGARNQVELSVPYSFTHDEGRWLGGTGDLGFGLKHVFASNLKTGTIFAAEGLVSVATGSPAKGTGNGTTTYEAFAAFDQMLPHDSFLEVQAGSEFPTHTATAPRASFWRMALGKSIRTDHYRGRMWTPITELIGDRDWETGAHNNWNVVPQFQVTLSRRQHVRANFGVSVPVNHTVGRPVQLVFYVLWDWFDGPLNGGWK